MRQPVLRARAGDVPGIVRQLGYSRAADLGAALPKQQQQPDGVVDRCVGQRSPEGLEFGAMTRSRAVSGARLRIP